jgi:hypothetical protein
MSQGPPNPGFRSVKVENSNFFSKMTHKISKKNFNLGFYEYLLQDWKAKLEGALSFDIHNCKKN